MNIMPPYLKTAEVARACDMTTRDVRNMLGRAGLLQLIGNRWLVSSSQLNERMPDIHERVLAHILLQKNLANGGV